METSLLTHPGFLGGVIGALIGLVGGLVGTYFSLRSAKSARERRWIIIFALGVVVVTVGFLCVLLTADHSHRVYWWAGFAVLYPPLLFLAIRFLQRLHKAGHECI